MVSALTASSGFVVCGRCENPPTYPQPVRAKGNSPAPPALGLGKERAPVAHVTEEAALSQWRPETNLSTFSVACATGRLPRLKSQR